MIYSKRLFNMSRIAWSISLLLLSCMSVFAQVPANDLVCNATPLTVNSTCIFSQYTTANATNSTGLGDPCFTAIGPDVWFSVVVPANGILNFDSNTGFITDGVMALYSGTCSGTLTELYCDDDGSGSNGLMPSFNTLGLTPGTTVYLRFYEYGGGNDGTFSLCVSSPAPVAPPANDNPCSATPLTVNSTCVFTQYTNANATATAGVSAPGCASYSGADVWFSAVVPANGILIFDSNIGVITDGGMAIYTGACGGLTLLSCDDDLSANGNMPFINQTTGLTPGSTVYLRFWEFGGDLSGTFSLCVSSPSAVAPPANDNPCAATPLTVGATCTYTQYTTANATATAGVPAPGCSSYLGGDVWFSIVVPANGILNFNSNTGIITDGGMALYSGTCSGTLTELYCDDDGSLNGLMPLIGATGLTPGSTVYLRFWEFGGDNNGTFSLCVSSQTITPPPTGNGDDCANSSPFCTGTNYNFSNNTNITSLGAISCLLTSPNPVWYYLEVDNAGNLDIDISQYDLFNNPIDVDFVLWGPFTNLANGCSQIQSSSAPVVDCSYSFSAFEQANIPNAQTGEIYILLLTNFSNTAGYITFNSTAGSVATTNCDILCNLTSLTAIPTSCNSITNTYNVSGQVIVTNPPESGILSLTSSCGGTTTLTAPFSNPINYTISSINAVSGSCNVVATFSADPTCSLSSPYTAPAACASVSLNCPDYANSSSSPTTACSNQTYYLDVANTVCAGQTFFSVAGNYGSQFGDEISWTVSSNLSGTTLASGIGNLSGANFNFSFGPFNPAIHGTIFTLNVLDSFGDGFNGVNGQIYVSQGGGIVGGPVAGAIGFGGSTIFGLNISISPATITVITPAGNVVQTVQNCNDFRVPISIENPNFCNTINVTLPWSVTCNSTGAVLASGSNSLIVYPTLPNSTNDVVSIQYNSTTCDWDVTGNNDCDAGDIGSIFTISPDPASLTNTSCTGGNQVFDVNYIGVGGGPNCCSTGGTLIPIQINNFYPNGSYGVASSPFGGINNAAYLNIPPNTVGGNASSLQLNINMNGFCMDPVGPNAGADYSYWVTVIVDGQIVSDLQTINPGPLNYSQTINLANIPGGFNSSMDIEVYIYPNLFANAGLTLFQAYDPIANCASLGNGIWTSSSITTNLAATFEEFEPTPATCLYPANAAFVCCSPTTVTNGTSTICSGGNISAVTTWQNSVVAANPTCVVYSSVLPLAGTTAPDNILPNGINSTTTPIVQTVSAYAYCDTDNNGDINLGDTYTLISTYTLTVNPNISAGTSSSTSICASGASVNLFGLLGGTPSSTGAWTGPSALSGGQLGTFNPASNAAGVYTYTVTGTSPCPNTSAIVTVTINSNPVASSSGTTTICSNQTTALSLSSTIAGTTYAWTVFQTGVSGASAGTGASISQTLITTAALAGTAVYTVTPTANGCVGLPIIITVTVNPLPNAGTNGAITVCSNSTNVNLFNSLLNFPTTGGTWSGPSSLTSASLGTFVPGTNTAGTYTYTLTSAGCPNTANVVVSVNPAAVVNSGSAQSICSGGSVTLAGSISGGASTGIWSAPSGSFSNASSLTSTYTPSITTGTVTLTLSSIDPDAGGPCTVVTSTVVITVSPTPNVTTTGTTSICSNQTTAIALTSAVAGTSFSWTVVQSGVTGASNASGNSIAQTLTNSGVVSGTAIYTVTPIANGCSGTPTTITVTVNPIPVASFLGTSPICSPSSPAITLSSNLSGTTYAWTVVQTNVTGASSGSGSSINQTLTNTGIVDGTAVYTVTPTANSCPGAAITITITVKPKPVASTLGGSYSICSGPTLATANSPSIQVLSNLGVGTTFAWSGSDGTSGTSNPISYAIPNNSCADQLITYSVIPTYNGCVGSATIIPLTVHPNPIAAFTISPSIICQNTAATVTFTGSACASSNYTWTWPTGATVLSGTGAGPYSINFASAGNLSVALSLTNAGGFCAAQTATVPITINASATATAGTDIAICSGSTINLAGIIGGSATSATWSASSGTFSDVNSLTSTYTPSITSGVVQLTLITNDPDGAGPCTFAVSSFNVTVNLAASISAGPNQTICSGNIAQLNGFVTGSAFLGTWSAPSGTFSSATLQNAIYTPPANASGNYILTYTSNDPAGVCPAVSSTVTVTVNPAATVAIGFFSQAICSGSSINLPGSFGGGATSATWSAPSGTFGNPNLAVTSYTPSITSGTVNITLTTNDPDGSGPCLATSTSRQIDVTQQPNATLTYPGSPYCQNETTNPLPVIIGTPGGTFSVNPISGLDIVSIGQISPSSSLAGTYTITYTIGSGGGCPAFVCSTQVVIYNQPPAPVIVPKSICAGIPQTVVASNGTWFGFSVDGIEVQAPSANNTYITPALALNSQVCVTSYPPSAFVFDGLINEPAWGPAWAYSTGGPASGFGANNIDALYLKDRSGYLFGGIAGRVQDNSNNRVLMFLDTKAGGFNSLAGWTNRNNSPYYSIRNLDAGITFDAGFEPDYILGINQALGVTYFDLYDMQNNTNVLLGDDISSNFLGYTANAGTGNYGAGFEFAIPMSAISNPVGSIQAFIMLVNDPGVSASTTLSNQFLTRANSGETNYGNGFVDFGNAAPNPISYSLSPECSTQTCIIASASATTVTDFSYVSPLCQSATNPSPTFVSGYTPGGTFSANSINLSINPSTGLINLAASLPGTYIITYSIAASSCSPAGSSTFSFTLNASITPVTGFTYTTPVCKNGTNPLVIPASGFTSGGSYSYIAIPSGLSTGLSFNTSTGAINLASSTPGTYTVTYSVVANGCQTAGSTSFTLTINPIPTTSSIFHD